MDIVSIFLLSVALAMDSFSISITRGMLPKSNFKDAFTIALFFGVFQAIMPVMGWFAGEQLAVVVSFWGPFLGFLLLLLIGGKMVYEGIIQDEDEELCKIFSIKEILILSVATSIDAFAVGVTFAFLKISILLPVVMIGLVTFGMSFLGVYIGKKVGHLFEGRIEIIGGIILIGIGFKILLEHVLYVH